MLWVLLLAATGATAAPVTVTNLITDDQLAHPAKLEDPNLQNAWGVSFSPGSPLWVSDNGTGVSTLYRIDASTNVPTKVGLTVTIPGDGSVTGQAFNTGAGAASPAFNGDNFLFVSEDGTSPAGGARWEPTRKSLQLASADNSYKGSAFADRRAATRIFTPPTSRAARSTS